MTRTYNWDIVTESDIDTIADYLVTYRDMVHFETRYIEQISKIVDQIDEIAYQNNMKFNIVVSGTPNDTTVNYQITAVLHAIVSKQESLLRELERVTLTK